MPSGPRTVTGDSPVSREPSSDLAHDTRETVEAWYRPLLSCRSRHRGWGRSLSLFSGVPSSSCPLFGPVNPLFLRPPTPSRFHARCAGRHCLAQRCHCAHGQPRHHGDTGMDWWICTSAAMYLRNVCHPGQHRSGTRRYITRSIDNGCISGRQRNLGGHALVYLSASKRRLRQPSHVPLGLPPWVSSREVITLDVRLALPAPISRYRRIFRSFPLGPVVCGASRLVFAGSPFCHLTMLGSADTGGLFFFTQAEAAEPVPVHGRRFSLQHRTKTTARCGEWATARKGAGRRGKGGKWETATGASGTALSLDPCEPWPFRLDTGRPLCEGIVPPQGECIPMCWGGDGPVSALLSTGNGTRQHIKMGHTLSRISTVAHLHLTNPSLLSV